MACTASSKWVLSPWMSSVFCDYKTKALSHHTNSITGGINLDEFIQQEWIFKNALDGFD
jgi:hypothetical protein